MSDVYQYVAEFMCAQLEQGVRPWAPSWKSGTILGFPLRHNDEPYQGVNRLILWCVAKERGFHSPYWMTFKQAEEYGAHVRKGEKSTRVIYANTVAKTVKDVKTGQDVDKLIPFLKSYNVFNSDQIEGLPAKFYPQPIEPRLIGDHAPLPHVEAYFDNLKADIRIGGNRAFFSPKYDFVMLPPMQDFESAEAFYATKAHELVHWTSPEKRLHRSFGTERWGDHGYAAEEMVAEIGAAFLCADLKICNTVREDHAQYLDHWLKVMKSDSKAIFKFTKHASEAVQYLHSLQPKQELLPTVPLEIIPQRAMVLTC